MNRKMLFAALLAAGLAAASFAAVSLAASGGKTPTATTIHLLEQETEPTSVPIGRTRA